MEVYFLVKLPHGRILKEKPKEQYLNIVPKFCPIINKSTFYLKLNTSYHI